LRDDVETTVVKSHTSEPSGRNPSIAELAQCLDLNINTDKSVRDIVVIGAGPAGLAAAVYAASEGLRTLVIEKSAPGGQAGSSSRIENYLGFPMGISGQELANISIAQAQKFGAQIMVAQSVVHIDTSRQAHPRIEIHYRTRIIRLSGAGHLEHVEWRDEALGETKSGPVRHVFVMAGAAPRTEWLEDSLVLDDTGSQFAHRGHINM
jgi:thioredoxin reductase